MKKIILFFILQFFPVHSFLAQTGICPQPTYCDRECWAPGGICPEDATPVYTDVTHIIVHHSAANYPANQDYKQVVRSYWDYHVNTHGWDDIGYNWLVDPNGVIYEGRGQDKKGAHFSGANSNTMGVCVIGNYQTATPTNVSIHSLEDLIAWEASRKNINVLTTGLHDPSGLVIYHVAGHRDGPGSTDCPGDNLYNLLPQIRQEVSQYPCYNGQTEGPANDFCENAIELASHENETYYLGTLEDAHYEQVLNKPACDDFADPSMLDVFYKFTAVQDTHIIKIVPFGDMDAVVSLYEGNTCNNLTEFACVDNGGGSGGEELMEATGLTPGNTYYIRIYDYGSEVPDNPNFQIAVLHTTLSGTEIINPHFKIYPNPVNSILQIQSSQSDIAEIRIFDINGSLLLFNKPNTKSIHLDVSTLAKGLYFVRIQDIKGGLGTYKFIKN